MAGNFIGTPFVPDIEGTKEDRCELTRTPYGRLFINEEINSYLESLFEMIVARGPSVGLNVSLSRFDFFHGHVFLGRDSGRLGILFHAKEYPAYDKEVFPCNMGYCQIGTNVSYDDSMNLRNILWLAPLASNSSNEWLAPGVLVVLDPRPTGVIYKDLIPEYVQIARTLYEDDFGDVAFDVNYLNTGDIAYQCHVISLPESKCIFEIFTCRHYSQYLILAHSSGWFEVDKDEYLDPQTAQIARVDHVKQVCKDVMPARDEELPSAFVEEYRSAMDTEIMKYVSETYPKGICSVYCMKGKDVEEPGFDFELVVVISAARHSPQNFCNGSWRSIWNIEFKDEIQSVEVRGEMQVGAHYFEEGNVQLDAKHECKDTTLIQLFSAVDCAVSFVCFLTSAKC
ncbi:hypothetical protein MTR67_040690 [Solanum verrucosum]|uniref:F-actin-capping protein subunit alpha n=1 Tax=Solanum verrucosum TaxID=315347 RepID=A0AAF0UIZ8_SOLVR|nr:hypothetical protein MTR67_040690 [Solanum verrucosum]